MTRQITLTLREGEGGWEAEWPYQRFRAIAATREGVLAMCRDYIAGVTGRPASETTIVWLTDEGDNDE